MVLFVTTSASDPDSKASRLNSYIALLTGPRVAAGVNDRLGLSLSTKEMQKKITAQVQDGTDLLVVTATDPDADRSRNIVSAATAALVTLAKQLDPQPTSAAAQTGAPTPSVTVAQYPVTSREPSSLVRNVAFAAVLGLLVGAGAVAIREATRRTINDDADLRRLGIGTVGVISLGSRYGRDSHPDEALAEGFRRLRSLLPPIEEMRQPDARGASLMLTGANPKEGTTAVACGLAIALAETGSKVLLVDANMRQSGVDRYLSLDEDAPGLAEVLTGGARMSDVLQDSLDGRLTVLPSGRRPRDPGEVLASPNLPAAMQTLTDRFDIVLVDAPPTNTVADATVLSKVTDGALLVVRANHSPAADVDRSIEMLRKAGTQLAGAVLNALPRKLPTGAPWNRADELTAHHDSALMPGFYAEDGDGSADADAARPAAADETVMVQPVRGRARVVRATFVNEPDDDEDDRPVSGAARGQARVVVITDAKPAADDQNHRVEPNLPAPRQPEQDRRSDE
jgi:capsular exopolysaccharide synthesis family protein